MIDGLFFPILVSAIITVALIGGLFKRASAWGLVDNPDTYRKTHLGSTPLIGGLAIFICVTVFQLAAPCYPLAITLALCALVIVGVVDDKNNLPALLKLALQFLAAAIAVFGGGVKIVSLGSLPNGAELLLGWFTIPVTMICIVGMINAVNMIDGIDGLAACLSILALIYLYFAAGITGQPVEKPTLIAMAVLAGALLGFLIFNLGLISGKKVFLGDAGSMMLGMFLAYVLIETSQRPPLISTLPASIMPWVAAVPVLDMAAVSIRRMLKGRSPVRADRTHLHHRLMDIGYSARQTLVLMLILSLVLFLFGILLTQMGGLHAGIGFLLILPVYVVFQGQIGQKQTKS